MIKKLKLKFILISLLSVFFVLFVTIGSINLSNYVMIENDASSSLTTIINEGINNNPDMNNIGPGPGDRGRDDPTMKERYFIVSFDSNGNINNFDYRHIFSISEQSGNELATKIYKDEISGGKYEEYRYKKVVKDDGFTYVAVVDVKERIDNFKNFLVLSTSVSLGAYLVLTVLIVFASQVVFKTSIESYKKQKQFITNASHELKTPLTIISADLDIIEMDNGKNEWSESIRDQITRLTNMTNQLVTLSKLNEDDVSNYPFASFSLSSIAKKVSESFITSFNKENISFSVEEDEDINYFGNQYLIEQLIYIFLDNSLKYTGGENKVSSLKVFSNKKNKVVLTFINSLDKDDEVDPTQVMDRFYRSPSNKKEGSGIGLSIASEIIALHKGKIEVSKDNNQIKFVITL